MRGFDKESNNKKISLFIYNSFSRKLLFSVSFFALDLIKRSHRLKKYYYIILKLQQNKRLVDDKITLFRRNVEEYTRFFMSKLELNMQRINNEIERFKQSLFLESMDAGQKNRYQIKGTRAEKDKRHAKKGLITGQFGYSSDDKRGTRFGREVSMNSYSESKQEQTSRNRVTQVSTNRLQSEKTNKYDSEFKIEVNKVEFNEEQVFRLDNVRREVFVEFLQEKLKTEKKTLTRTMMSKSDQTCSK